MRMGYRALAGCVLFGATALGGCNSVTTGLYGSAAEEADQQQLVSSGGAGPSGPVRLNMDPEEECPQVNVPSGSSSYASYAGAPDAGNVRFQARISDFARECVLNAGNTVTIRVGVEGRVILGSKGSPGTYLAPLTISVRDRSGTIVASRAQRLSVTVPAGDTQGKFRIVEDAIVVPVSLDKPLSSYEILVGFQEGGGTGRKRRG
jgi:hypothetical protein